MKHISSLFRQTSPSWTFASFGLNIYSTLSTSNVVVSSEKKRSEGGFSPYCQNTWGKPEKKDTTGTMSKHSYLRTLARPTYGHTSPMTHLERKKNMNLWIVDGF